MGGPVNPCVRPVIDKCFWGCDLWGRATDPWLWCPVTLASYCLALVWPAGEMTVPFESSKALGAGPPFPVASRDTIHVTTPCLLTRHAGGGAPHPLWPPRDVPVTPYDKRCTSPDRCCRASADFV